MIRGATRRERLLTGVVFVVAAMLITVVLVRFWQVAHGALALPSPKAEDGFLVLLGLIVIVFVSYIMGTRVARLLWRSRIRFYKTYQHQ